MTNNNQNSNEDNSVRGRIAKFLGVDKILVTIMCFAFGLLGAGAFLALTLYAFFTSSG